jgi:hypothetical protein
MTLPREELVGFVYPDDDTPKLEGKEADMLRLVFAILEDGPPRTMAARLEALKHHFHMSFLPLRGGAQKARCSVATMLKAKKKIQHAFPEVK